MTSLARIFPVLATLLLADAIADDTPPADAEKDDPAFDTIVVTATRMSENVKSIAGAISLVDGNYVQRAQQQLALDESLVGVPGVFFQNRYNFAQDLRISIRGFGSRSSFGVRGIRILVDDIPETLADGQTQVDSIDLGSVRQIEVLRGSSSALYGNAAGGVINIQSENGSADSFIEGRFSFGDYGFSKHQIKTGGAVGRFDYMLNVSDLEIDGYREHSEAKNTQLSTKLRFTPDDKSQFSLVLSHTDQPISNDSGGLTVSEAEQDPSQARTRNVDFDAGEELDQQKVGLVYSRTTANGGEFMIRNYYLWRDFANKLPFTDGGAVSFERFFAGGGLSYVHPGDIAGLPNRVIVGLDLDRQNDDRLRYDNNLGTVGNLTFDQTETVTSSGFFVQDELIVSEAFEFSLGARYDRVEFKVQDHFLVDGDDSGSRTLDQVSPTVGFIVDATAYLNIYANISTSFQTPTSTEFANADGSAGFNPDLEPQKASNYEIGLRGTIGNKHRYEAVVFTIDVNDELVPFEVPANPGRDYYVNAAMSTRNGIELSYQGSLSDHWQVSMAYTYSDYSFDQFIDDDGNDFSGNQVPGIPTHFLFSEISYDHPAGFYGAISLQYTDELYANNANTDTIDDYLIANLRLGFDAVFGSLDVSPFIGVNNLLDEAYTANVRLNAFGGRYFEPGPPRNIYAGISLKYRFSGARN
jgi:iron complex outermembrane receptor protein